MSTVSGSDATSPTSNSKDTVAPSSQAGGSFVGDEYRIILCRARREYFSTLIDGKRRIIPEVPLLQRRIVTGGRWCAWLRGRVVGRED